MDNTFENGFMCGLLLSIDDSKPHTNVKDPVFRDILENGVPVATINLSSHYKNVLTWYQFTKFPCSYSTDLRLGQLIAIDETQYYVDQSGYYYTDTHYESYYKHWGPIVLFSVIYKGEEPLFASNIYYSNSIYPVYKYHVVMQENYSADHVVGPNPYEKELVYYKSVDYKFLIDDIKYMGNYRLAAELNSHGTTGSTNTTMHIAGFISEEDDKAYSQLQLSCPIEKYQYSSSETNTMINSRPKITLDATSTQNISYNLKPDNAYKIITSNGTYGDFTIDELADVQFNIYYDISCELGKGVINPPKKAILLN